MLAVVRGAAERMAELEGFSSEEAHGLIWAIDEALANVIKHGYNGQTDRPITITLGPVRSGDGKSSLKVVIRDEGKQVDPATIKGRNLDEIRPGGLGVHIIQSVMDQYNWSCPNGGGMLLEMIKYISEKPAPAQGS